MKLHTIRIAENVVIELTAREFTDLHDRLTDYYNDNYELISREASND